MITITGLWIGALVLLLFFLARGVRTVRRVIRCALRGTHVRVSFLEAEPEGRLIEVTACSEFRPEAAIACDRGCRELLGRRATPPADRPDVGTELVTSAPERTSG